MKQEGPTVNETSTAQASNQHRIQKEHQDSFDEELEMEIDDERLPRLLDEGERRPDETELDRRRYFNELFRLQAELVKLQDWIVEGKRKAVVVFEGRDAAGKGGVIKRITSTSRRFRSG